MRPPQPPQRPMVRPTARPVLRLALMELLLISGEARRCGRADPVEGNCHADHPLSPDEPSPCRCFPSEPSLSKRLDEEGRSWSSWQPQVKGRTGEAHITRDPVGSLNPPHVASSPTSCRRHLRHFRSAVRPGVRELAHAHQVDPSVWRVTSGRGAGATQPTSRQRNPLKPTTMSTAATPLSHRSGTTVSAPPGILGTWSKGEIAITMWFSLKSGPN